MFLLSAVSSVVTLVVQRGSISGIEAVPPLQRGANALISTARYLRKATVPAALTSMDLLPADPWPAWQVAAGAALLCAVSAAAIWLWRRLPYFLTGWLWFLGMLLPVIGLVQVGRQATADRYTYLPLIGLLIAATWCAGEVGARGRRQAAAVAGVAGMALPALAAAVWWQAEVWRDDLTLFHHAVRVDPANWVMQNNLGTALERVGREEEALAHFRMALEAHPGHEKAWYNLGHTPGGARAFRGCRSLPTAGARAQARLLRGRGQPRGGASRAASVC